MIAFNAHGHDRVDDRIEPLADLGGPDRILVLSASGLGDLIFATPMFAALRQRYPAARIDLFTMFESAAAVARCLGVFDEVICHDLMGGSRRATAQVLWTLRRRRYDLSVLTFPSNRIHYNLLAALVGAPVRLGHDYRAGGDLGYGRFLLTDRIAQGPQTHAVEENLKLARRLGCRPRSFKLRVGTLGEGHEDWVGKLLSGQSGPLIGIHPGCDVRKNHAHRRWPVERYEQLLSELHAQAGASGLVVLGPTEDELAARLAACGDHVVVVQGQPIDRVACALRSCDVFVSSDSGIGHLAAACGVPSVQVLGPTNSDYIRPWGVEHRVVRRGTACSPCFEYSKHPLCCRQLEAYRCLSGLGVGDVLDACLSLLNAATRIDRGVSSHAAPRLTAAPAGGAALGLNAEASS